MNNSDVFKWEPKDLLKKQSHFADQGSKVQADFVSGEHVEVFHKSEANHDESFGILFEYICTFQN